MSDLAQRISSAALFLLIVLGGIFSGQTGFLLLFALIGTLCLWEYTGLVMAGEKNISTAARALVIMTALWPYISTMSLFSRGETPLSLLSGSWLLSRFALFWVFLLILLLLGLFKYPRKPFLLFSTALSGAFYIVLPLIVFSLAVSPIKSGYQPLLALGLLSLSWLNDTGAYFIGSRWGRHKLLPAVSPGKSWEGLFGGLAATLILALLLNQFIPLPTPSGWFIPALAASVLGPLGDLLESAMKRSAGLKDSGNILPGHGGALDRFDAFLFHLPVSGGYLVYCLVLSV